MFPTNQHRERALSLDADDRSQRTRHESAALNSGSRLRDNEEDVIATGRRMMGATKPKDSAPGTIRGGTRTARSASQRPTRRPPRSRLALTSALLAVVCPLARQISLSTWAATSSTDPTARSLLPTRSLTGSRRTRSQTGSQPSAHGSTSKRTIKDSPSSCAQLDSSRSLKVTRNMRWTKEKERSISVA